MNETWWVGQHQLNGEQKRVIALPLEGNYLITGPPGCGKTNLVLLRANYLTLSGHADIRVVVFTRTLQEFIRSGSDQYSFPPERVVTLQRWQQQLLREYGYEHQRQGSFADQRQFLTNQMLNLIQNERLGHIHECILLDEAQDYTPAEVTIFLALGKRVFAVADSYQKIYPGEDPLENLRSITDQHLALKYHYRCGLQICRTADAIYRGVGKYTPLRPTSQYDEDSRPSTVEHHIGIDIKGAAENIVLRVESQLKAYPDELIGVIAPRREEAHALGEIVSRAPFADISTIQTDDENVSFSPETRVCVCTLHAAKGLEFRALHIAGCEFLSRFQNSQKRMAYTGITRAKTSLSLYSSGRLPAYLEQAVLELGPLPALPSIDEVFKGGH